MFGIDLPWYGWMAAAVVLGGGMVWWFRSQQQKAKADEFTRLNLEAQAKMAPRIEDAERQIENVVAEKEKQTGPVQVGDWKF